MFLHRATGLAYYAPGLGGGCSLRAPFWFRDGGCFGKFEPKRLVPFQPRGPEAVVLEAGTISFRADHVHGRTLFGALRRSAEILMGPSRSRCILFGQLISPCRSFSQCVAIPVADIAVAKAGRKTACRPVSCTSGAASAKGTPPCGRGPPDRRCAELRERYRASSISGGNASEHGLEARLLEILMLKFLGIVVAIIFIIGLLVVMGVFKLIF